MDSFKDEEEQDYTKSKFRNTFRDNTSQESQLIKR